MPIKFVSNEIYLAIQDKLGKFTDVSISREYKIPAHQIAAMRRCLSIPTFNSTSEEKYDEVGAITRLAQIKSKLGKISDSEICRQFRLTHWYVCRLRAQLNIAAYEAPLEKRTDTNNRTRFKSATAKAPYLKIDSTSRDAITKVVGSKSDQKIAADIGCSAAFVRRLRGELGIDKFQPEPKQPRKITPVVQRLLGKMLDRDLGRISGINRRTIEAYRQKFNLPLYEDSAETPAAIQLFDLNLATAERLRRILQLNGYPQATDLQQLFVQAQHYTDQLREKAVA